MSKSGMDFISHLFRMEKYRVLRHSAAGEVVSFSRISASMSNCTMVSRALQ